MVLNVLPPFPYYNELQSVTLQFASWPQVSEQIQCGDLSFVTMIRLPFWIFCWPAFGGHSSCLIKNLTLHSKDRLAHAAHLKPPQMSSKSIKKHVKQHFKMHHAARQTSLIRCAPHINICLQETVLKITWQRQYTMCHVRNGLINRPIPGRVLKKQ